MEGISRIILANVKNRLRKQQTSRNRPRDSVPRTADSEQEFCMIRNEIPIEIIERYKIDFF